MFFNNVWHLIKDSFNAWLDDFAPSMGAALAFYTLFSLAPLLLIVIGIAGLLFGHDSAQRDIIAQLTGLLGSEGAGAIKAILKSAGDPASGVIATVVGAITLIIGATTVFNELQSDLDRIWKVKPAAFSIRLFARTRMLSMGIIFGTGFLLIISLLVSAALAALGHYWDGMFGELEFVLRIVNFWVSTAVITLLFALIYKILPSIKLEWRDVWVGAVVTALLFTLGKLLIGLYLGNSGVGSAYGAAGAFVIVLLWVYYSAQIFLLGAEFTRIYTDRYGSRKPVRSGSDSVEHSAGFSIVVVLGYLAALFLRARRRKN